VLKKRKQLTKVVKLSVRERELLGKICDRRGEDPVQFIHWALRIVLRNEWKILEKERFDRLDQFYSFQRAEMEACV